MQFIDSNIYQKAFDRYLRRGTPIELSIKALLATKADRQESPDGNAYYVWVTQSDDKVRASHAANNGMIFAWDDPPATGHPGAENNCRCSAVPYDGSINDPPIEPVYPEFYLLPLLRGGKLVSGWLVFLRQRNISKNWTLGWHKTPLKWRNRLEKGDWTPEKITRTIRNGSKHRAPNKPFPSNKATRYQLGEDFVVVDDVTKEIIQVSRPRLKPEIF